MMHTMSYKKTLLILSVVISPGILDTFLNNREHQRWHATKNCIEILSAVLWTSENDNAIQPSVIIYTIHNYLKNGKLLSIQHLAYLILRMCIKVYEGAGNFKYQQQIGNCIGHTVVVYKI
jgi:hypothetical protein